MGDISEHLSRDEVACKCNCGFKTADYKTVIMFEQAREFEGHAVTPNSWCRCPSHNKKEGGSSGSKHMEGIACDFPTAKPKELYDYLDSLYPDSCGLGLYNDFVHFDSRETKARWDKRT